MQHEFTKEEIKGVWSFLVETFKFTEEQTDAIDHQIPMTQALFDSILDRCSEVGSDADKLFYRMLEEYPDFVAVRADMIEKEVSQVEFPKLTEEELEHMRQNLYVEIRRKFGEDAI